MTDLNVSEDQLRAFVERIESLEAEKKETATLIAETYSEMKGMGYDVKCVRSLISLRRKDANDIAEQEAIMEVYKQALGMD